MEILHNYEIIVLPINLKKKRKIKKSDKNENHQFQF